MKHRGINMVGRQFGRLEVMSRASGPDSAGKHVLWWCRCSCNGQRVKKNGNYLRNGDTKSCGCLHKERTRELVKKFPSRRRVNDDKWNFDWVIIEVLARFENGWPGGDDDIDDDDDRDDVPYTTGAECFQLILCSQASAHDAALSAHRISFA